MLGLQALHECGWVHRDISIGNILVVDDGAKIADLEYAKRVDDDSPMHQGRTVRIVTLHIHDGIRLISRIGHGILYANRDQVAQFSLCS